MSDREYSKLDVTAMMFRYELRELRTFFGEIQSHISAQAERHMMDLDKDPLPGAGDYSERALRFQFHYPGVLYETTFLSAFAYLEFYLTETAKHLQAEFGSTLAIADLRGSGIKRATNYFEKALGVPVATGTPLWMDLYRLSELRNRFVHNGRRVNEQKLVRVEVNAELLHLINEGKAVLHAAFVPYVLERFGKLADQLENAIKARLDGGAPPA